jgi:peptide/nickel transport system permease protein
VLTFILRRLLSTPPLLFGVSLITFFLLRAAPGDFFDQMRMDPSTSMSQYMEQRASAGLLRRLSPDQRVELGRFEARGSHWEFTGDGLLRDGAPTPLVGLDSSLKRFEISRRAYEVDEKGGVYTSVGALAGYTRWFGRALKLDFGRSYGMRRPVWGLIVERLINTLKLSLAALALAWGLAIPLGVGAAVYRNGVLDHLCSFIAFFGLSIPSVFFALLMILFASYSGWFPIGDMRDVVNYDSMTTWQKIVDELHHLILPAVVIGTGTMAGYMRQARGNMLETLAQNYVRTARAKGVSERVVLFKHALRNAINPLITLFGYSLAALLSGSFLVEVVMNWPGMARLIVDAIFARDEPIVMAAVLMGALLLVAGNLAADLLLPLVDPRVRVA